MGSSSEDGYTKTGGVPVSDPKQALRRRAEELAAPSPSPAEVGLPASALEDSQLMLHELQLHQIELQMQNDELRRTQTALDAARAHFFDLYDLAPAGYCTLSKYGMILEANLTAASMLDLPRSVLLRRPFSRFILAEDQSIFYLHLRKLRGAGQETQEDSAPASKCELRMTRKNSAPFWAQLTLTTVSAADLDPELSQGPGASIPASMPASIPASMPASMPASAPLFRVVITDITEIKRTEQALRESEDRLREVLENSLDASYKRNLLTNTYDYLSPTFRQISGYTPEEMETLPIETVLDLMHPDDLLEIEFVIAESMIGSRGSSYQVDYRFKHKDGHYRWFHDQFIVIRDVQGQPSARIGSVSDITERKRVEEMLNISETRYRRLFETTKDGVLILDEETGKIIDVNPFLIELLGYSPEQFLEKEIWEIGFFKDIAANRDKFLELQHNQYVRYENLPLETADGRRIHVEFVSNVYLVKDMKVIQCNIRDTTAHKEAEEKIRLLNIELEQLAGTDGLTGILNHRSLLKLAEHEFDVAMRYQPPLSMLFFDLDHFKQINDTFGHAMGDQALKMTIHTVCAELRSADLIGRYGGDEFVILLPQTRAQDALPLAERIHARIAAMRLDTGKGPLTLTISIGIAQTIHEPSQTDTVENLLQRADQALYAAKQAGRNRTVVFASETMG